MRWFNGPRTNPDTARGRCLSVATEKVEDTIAKDHTYGVTPRLTTTSQSYMIELRDWGDSR